MNMEILTSRWIIVVCAAMVLLVGLLVRLNRQRQYNVEFIVPDGFHGIFVIQEDRKNGVPPERIGTKIRYVIPKSGTLVTTDTSPLDAWHAESAKYSSGRSIPDQAGLQGKGHILITLIYDSSGRTTFLIGSNAEETQYWQDHNIWFRIEEPGKK